MNSLSKVIKIDKSFTQVSRVTGKVVDYLNDAEVKKVVEEKIERVRSKAFQQGYEKGRAEARRSVTEQFKNASKEIINLVDNLNKYIDSVNKELEQEIIELVLSVSETVIRNELSRPDVVSKIIIDSLRKINTKRALVIKLHPDSGHYFEQIAAVLKEQNFDLESIKIEIDENVGVGGCFIESDKSIIDGRLDSILKEVKETMRELIKWQIPAPPQE
ncbi:hypothetical protein J7L67_06760 [bacterium]|nr:hypothetical protein [bacterium]